ncbi:MAG TPA: uridine kinase, partial [Caulobacteraceae bacterium]|nr:uridine kinase [Caulobacteraceae bacterium]
GWIVGVAGGSGSGKSLFARALAERLGPRTVVLISEDDYYRRFDHPGFDPRRFDFDVPSARDHAQLAGHLQRLRQGFTVDRPVYSFRIHAPLKRRAPTPPADVVIVEGLHVLHDPAVRAGLDFSIFLEVDDDLRFIRRLLRDIRERGRSVRGVTDQYLATVKPAHSRYVAPAKALADLVLTYEAREGDSDAANLELWLNQASAALEAMMGAG